jgi:hypothetical protein
MTGGGKRRGARVALLGLAAWLSTCVAVSALAVLLALAAGACPSEASGIADAPSAAARTDVPSQLLPIYEQAGAEYGLPWEVLAGIGTEECAQGEIPDPSCRLQPGATGPGVANYAGASGLMQIGVGGAAGDEYGALRRYLPNPALGPHDPLTSVRLAALVLIRDKGAPRHQPIDAYLPYVTAYNGAGGQADAYGARVIADAHRYQGTGQSSFVSTGTVACTAGAAGAGGYVNPFAHARVSASRIDQGVDYGGSGPIEALGPGKVVLVSNRDTGWGNGDGWVSYQLTAGRYAGAYIYVAEGITPTVHVGDVLAAGQQIGAFNGHSIEIGFAADGQSDTALAHSIYWEGADTAAGRAMSQLLSSLGAPGGHADAGAAIVGGPVPAAGTAIG